MKIKINNINTLFLAVFVGSLLILSSFGNSASAAGNPYTNKCPGNKVKYGAPDTKKGTGTVKARKKVFGNPSPNANTEVINFMGKDVRVHKKVSPCLKAVEWDLLYKYKTNYRLRTIYGASDLNSQNPAYLFHAYGGAVDINPADNPYCPKGNKCKYGMPLSWRKAFKSHGFFWGGNFKDNKDYMHFEWHGQR